MARIVLMLALLGLAACGEVKPGTPGHEPPSAEVNPVTGQRGGGAR